MLAIGTGGVRYAHAFIEDEQVPFEVVLDEDGSAAEIAGTNTLGMVDMIKPKQVLAGMRAGVGGNRQHNTGRRPFQLGATLVIGPGDTLHYADFEDFAGDHAPLDDVLAAIPRF